MEIRIPDEFITTITTTDIENDYCTLTNVNWNIEVITNIYTINPDDYNVTIDSLTKVIPNLTNNIILYNQNNFVKYIDCKLNSIKHDELYIILKAASSGCLFEINSEPFKIYRLSYNRIIGLPNTYKLNISLTYYPCFYITDQNGVRYSSKLINNAVILKSPIIKSIKRFWNNYTIVSHQPTTLYLDFEQETYNVDYGDLTIQKNIFLEDKIIQSYTTAVVGDF